MSFLAVVSPNSLGGDTDLGEKVDPRRLLIRHVLRQLINYSDMLPKCWMFPDLPKCPNALRRPFDVDILKDARGALLVPVSAHQPQRPWLTICGFADILEELGWE